MNEILFNLALFDATDFCVSNGIDCAGSHLIKDGRGFKYTLMRDAEKIVTVTFHKTARPSHVVHQEVPA